MSSSTQTSRVFLITGCSTGLGHAMAKYFLEHGQKVVATARYLQLIQHFASEYPETALVLTLDVTSQVSITAAIEQTIKRFGRIDVLVNNAGYGLFGVIEETTEQDIRAQFETNFFGAVKVTQAVLPIMRGQQSGHIIQISSVGGIIAAPTIAIYNASKFALEGFSEGLAQEVASFNIRVTIVEPGAFRTAIYDHDAMGPRQGSSAYASVVEQMTQFVEVLKKNSPGDPAKAAAAIHKVVESADPPLRLPLGADAVQGINQHIEKQVKELKEWEHVSLGTNFSA